MHGSTSKASGAQEIDRPGLFRDGLQAIRVARLDRSGELVDRHELDPLDSPVPLRRAATPSSRFTAVAKNLRRSPRLS
jgi:hypothetical protein